MLSVNIGISKAIALPAELYPQPSNIYLSFSLVSNACVSGSLNIC